MIDPGSLMSLVLAATVLLGVACLLVWTVPVERASARHQIWTLALAGVLLLPILHSTMPSYLGTALADLSGPINHEVGVGPESSRVESEVESDLRIAWREASPDDAERSVDSLETAWLGGDSVLQPLWTRDQESARSTVGVVWRSARTLGGLWLLGTLAFGAGLWRSYRAAGRLACRGALAVDPWTREAAHAAGQLGLGSAPEVRLVAGLDVPVATGLVRPRILLPSGAERWARDRRYAVLLHETAHLRRRDLWTALIGDLARVAFWFHPLVWLAIDRQHSAAERACDQAVLGAGVMPRHYAGDLLAIARQARLPHFGAALAFGRRRRLRHRVESILSFDHAAVISTRPSWFAVLALLCTVGILGLLHPEPMRRADGGAVDSEDAVRQTLRRNSALEDLEHGDAAGRSHAAWVLGQLETPLAVEALHRALEDSDAEVRGMAAWALGEIKSPRSVPALIAALAERDPLAREMIVKALGELESPRASGALAQVLQAPGSSAELRRATVWALGEITSRELRYRAIRAAGPKASFATGSEATTMTGVRAPLTARRGAPGPSEALTALASVSRQDPDQELRAAAVRAMPVGPDTVAVLLAALDDRQAVVRRAAAMKLGRAERGGSVAQTSVSALVKALGDSSAGVRREAATGLGLLRAPAAADALIARLRDDDPAVRDAATWALDELDSE